MRGILHGVQVAPYASSRETRPSPAAGDCRKFVPAGPIPIRRPFLEHVHLMGRPSGKAHGVRGHDHRLAARRQIGQHCQHFGRHPWIERLVGSSNSMARGCIASARAIATRCCWPPEAGRAADSSCRPGRRDRAAPFREACFLAPQPQHPQRRFDYVFQRVRCGNRLNC